MSRSVVTLTMPARTDYLILARLALAGIARDVAIDETVLADLKLAVTEACGNAARHAYPSEPGLVRVRFEIERGTMTIWVEDDGTGTGAAAWTNPTAPSPFSEDGMSLAVIRAIVDELDVSTREGSPGTVVRMRKQLLPV